MGIMAMSAPSENSPIPKIRRTAPRRKLVSISAGIGTIAAHKIITRMEIGATECRDSLTFAFNLFKVRASSKYRKTLRESLISGYT
jgi:hypothetical protein